MIRFLSIAVLAILLYSTSNSHALSCVPPQFDAEAIAGLELVFSGVVEKKQSPSSWKKIKSRFNNEIDSDASTYTFKITQIWKGKPAAGERVKVLASPGWEQQSAYQLGKTYLVFGEMGDDPGTYKSSPNWCGFDVLPKEQVIAVLEEYLSDKNQDSE